MREVFMIRQKRTEFSVFVLLALSFWLTAYSLVMTERVMETVRNALRVFAFSVLPPLAVFSVCSKLLLKSGAVRRFRLGVFSGVPKALGMSEGGFFAFLIGLVAGFPTGAAILSELYERGEISKGEAESLLPFCNQASAAFLFGTVGTGMLDDPRAGLVFFTAQMVTACICICLTSGKRRDCKTTVSPEEAPRVSFSSVLTVSIGESAFSMLGVCGFIVFFSLLTTALFDTLSAIGFSVSALFAVAFGGFLEISSGFLALSQAAFSDGITYALGGMLLGFGGVSVFMQALDRTEAFFYDPLKYFEGKILSSIICPLFSLLFFCLYGIKNGKFLIIATSLSVICFFYLLNCVKIKFFSKKCGKIERNAV
jgi:hypothetical protein